MGKKTDTSKKTPDTTVTAKPAAKTLKKPAVQISNATSSGVPKKTGKSVAKSTPGLARKASFAPDDIALRAYFIAEKRQKAGLPGDAHQDWIEAERQLSAESRKKSGPKTVGKT